MQYHSYNQLSGRKVQRIEALTDGIFAVAFTLLVLDIHVPLVKGLETETALLHALGSIAPKLLSYFMSFLTLGIFWMGISAQYSFVRRADRNLNWIAICFLMFVSLLPFTTAFLSQYIEYKVGVGLYWLNILALGSVILWHWEYAYRHDMTHGDGLELKAVHLAMRKRIISAQAFYFSAALLCFINTYLSIGLMLLVQLNYAIAPGFTSPRRRNIA